MLALLRVLGPLYMKAALRLDGLELRGAEKLVSAWKDFQDGRARLILAFRHPYGDEPQLFSYLFDLIVPREARRLGTALRRRTHARFVHGYEVPLWSGPFVRWLLPRIGAVPVYHARHDSASVTRIRTIAKEDDFPLALAPEGQVSYRSETLPRMENGTARRTSRAPGDPCRSTSSPCPSTIVGTSRRSVRARRSSQGSSAAAASPLPRSRRQQARLGGLP